ncbi:hypothetical protein BVRB_4g085540 [Beta vulgaris subsp. vulgaris]|nr:hypothetical protein BVRB_4g085540 [Beta vulgaris subsp. vulgaris]
MLVQVAEQEYEKEKLNERIANFGKCWISVRLNFREAKSLPFWQQEFLKVLSVSENIVLIGETGSGKSTQLA